jgi:predicted esterase
MKMENMHHGQPLLTVGETVENARTAMIMLHGRGAGADDIISLHHEFVENGMIYLAPQAAQNSWYPYRFIESIEANEPWLTSALQIVDDLVEKVIKKGISREKLIILGFSQGACLALEYSIRNAEKYGGVIGLSGGLIGPPGTEWNYSGSLENTPVFLGCSDKDFHIPKERVIESAEILEQKGADVSMKLYPDLGHTINQDEIETIRRIITKL